LKIVILISSFIVLTAILGVISIGSINHMTKNSEIMYNEKMMANELLSQLITNNTMIQSYEIELVLGEINIDSLELEKQINELVTESIEIKATFEKTPMLEEAKALYVTYNEQIDS